MLTSTNKSRLVFKPENECPSNEVFVAMGSQVVDIEISGRTWDQAVNDLSGFMMIFLGRLTRARFEKTPLDGEGLASLINCLNDEDLGGYMASDESIRRDLAEIMCPKVTDLAEDFIKLNKTTEGVEKSLVLLLQASGRI